MPIHSIKDVIGGRNLAHVPPGLSVTEACAELTRRNIGALAVMKGNKLVGVMSERDVIRKCVSAGEAPERLTVADIMTPEPQVIDAECSLAEALDTMEAGQFRHLPVMENGRATGMLSLRDIPTEYRLMWERFHEHKASPMLA